MKKISLFIFSAVPVTIEGFRSIIKSRYTIASSDQFDKASIFLTSKPPDILLVDDCSLDKDALTLFLKSITKTSAGSNTIVFSASKDGTYIYNLASAGIKGLLHKNSTSKMLFDAVESINEGKTYYDKQFTNMIINQKKVMLTEFIGKLSRREKEVLMFMNEGVSNKDAADRMNVKVKTVETYKERIKDKLNVNSIEEVYYVMTGKRAS